MNIVAPICNYLLKNLGCPEGFEWICVEHSPIPINDPINDDITHVISLISSLFEEDDLWLPIMIHILIRPDTAKLMCWSNDGEFVQMNTEIIYILANPNFPSNIIEKVKSIVSKIKTLERKHDYLRS